MTDRNQICLPGRVSTLPDAQPRPTNRQTSFSGRGNVCSASGHIVNKFRRPAILQLNIEGLTASKMNVFHYLAVQFEALVILLQETHCAFTETHCRGPLQKTHCGGPLQETRPLQETHCAFTDKLVIPGFALAGSCLNRIHGLASYICP